MSFLLDNTMIDFSDVSVPASKLGIVAVSQLVDKTTGDNTILLSNKVSGGLYNNVNNQRSSELVLYTDNDPRAIKTIHSSQPYIKTLVTHESSPIVLAIAYPDGQVYRSEDYGKTFKYIKDIFGASHKFPFIMIRDPAQSMSIILVCNTSTGQIYRSIDDGESFTPTQQLPMPFSAHAFTLLDNGVILLHTVPHGFEYDYVPGGHLFRSIDNGQTFQPCLRINSVDAVTSVIPMDHNCVLAITQDGTIYRSSDSGESFEKTTKILSTETNHVLDFEKPTLLYLGSSNVLAYCDVNGVMFRSNDYGNSFTLLDCGFFELPKKQITHLSNNAIIASSGLEHLFSMSLDGGESFTTFPIRGIEMIYKLSNHSALLIMKGNTIWKLVISDYQKVNNN